MYRTFRLSYFFLCAGLAVVFFWFGADKFFHPNYWLQAWTPVWFKTFLTAIHLQEQKFIYLIGAFEMLVGVSLLSGILRRIMSLLAVIFLVAVFIGLGFNQILVRDIGLVGGLLAVATWPEERLF